MKPLSDQCKAAVEAERKRIYALILCLAEHQDYATSMSWKALRRMLILSDHERGLVETDESQHA